MSAPYYLQDETKLLIGIAYEIHNILGKGFLEIVYKDALEYELRKRSVYFEREKEYAICYKGIVLPHKFYADFVVFEQVIVEIKAQEGIADVHYSQLLNYLRASGCKVGLILNLGETSLKVKRMVL
ncbi:MAG: GTP-binding signal recognition particle [Sediminibacterium sp.]|nr:GTP-binding signal recognition particle [Sediminibacterium sp.]